MFKLVPPKRGQSAWSYRILYDFPKKGKRAPKGRFINGPLIVQKSGAIVGTAQTGGSSLAGTIFRLGPPSQSGERWKAKVLYDVPASAAVPVAGLARAAGGGLYGATGNGTHGRGAVFSFQP